MKAESNQFNEKLKSSLFLAKYAYSCTSILYYRLVSLGKYGIYLSCIFMKSSATVTSEQ